MKKILRVSGTILACMLTLIFVIFAAISLIESPTYSWRLLRYGESDINDYKIFPSRGILNEGAASEIPVGSNEIPDTVEYPYMGKMHTESLEDILTRTGTRAFLVIKDDKLVYEKYIDSSRDSINTSFSSAKSFDSALIGAAIADGYISSVDDRVIDYIPEIKGRGLDELTIRDLLLMNSGVKYKERSELPFYYMLLADDALTYYSEDMREKALSVKADGSVIGASFHYNNFHPLLEGVILERATGMPVAKYLQERIWKPMGAEYPASWSLDSESSGFEKMESGINARAIDYARFGLIFLHNGKWNGNQILPEDWVSESTQPLRPDTRDWSTLPFWPEIGGYYAYHWWGFSNEDGSYDFFAHGKYDQLIYIAPRKNIVIIRLGEAPDKYLSWPLVMYQLVDQIPK